MSSQPFCLPVVEHLDPRATAPVRQRPQLPDTAFLEDVRVLNCGPHYTWTCPVVSLASPHSTHHVAALRDLRATISEPVDAVELAADRGPDLGPPFREIDRCTQDWLGSQPAVDAVIELFHLNLLAASLGGRRRKRIARSRYCKSWFSTANKVAPARVETPTFS